MDTDSYVLPKLWAFELWLSEFEKRTYTVSEIQEILGIGRNAAYAIVKKGCFSTVRIGGIIRISKRSFDEWLDTLSEPCQVCDDIQSHH